MPESDTRDRILDAAQELIQRLGANAMSYQHISDAVGIRKASIHHHFPTKETLIETLLRRYSASFLSLTEQIAVSAQSPSRKLAAYIGLFEATLCEGRNQKACLCGMLGAELATLGSPSARLVREFFELNERALARILEQGREAGDFRFAGDSKALAAMIFAMLEGAVLIGRARDGRPYLKRITAQLMKLVRGAA